MTSQFRKMSLALASAATAAMFSVPASAALVTMTAAEKCADTPLSSIVAGECQAVFGGNLSLSQSDSTQLTAIIGTDDNGGSTNPVPEPQTYALMLAGLGVVALVARRRKQR